MQPISSVLQERYVSVPGNFVRISIAVPRISLASHPHDSSECRAAIISNGKPPKNEKIFYLTEKKRAKRLTQIISVK